MATKQADTPILAVALVMLLAAAGAVCGQESTLVVNNARVVVGDGTVRENVSVIIENGRVRTVSSPVSEPSGRTVIDARGRTVMPGLIDCHMHVFSGKRGKGEQAFRQELQQDVPNQMKQFLRHGVTTIKSTGDPLTLVLELREQLKSGAILGPRLFVVGPGFTAPGGHPATTICHDDPWWRSEHAIEVDTAAAATVATRRLAERGVDAVKIAFQSFEWQGRQLPKLSVEAMHAVIAEAHRHGLRATVHTWNEQDALVALESGADGLEHGVIQEAISGKRLSRAFADCGAFYVPTLHVIGSVPGAQLSIGKQNLKSLADDHVRLALGTDTFTSEPWKLNFPPGLSTIEELELWAEAGLKPDQIIRAATKGAAEHLGLLADLGTVEPGKIADLLIVDGDPLKDISAMRKVTTVLKSGWIVLNRE